MSLAISALTSITTLVAMWACGDGRRWGWWVNALNQIIWIIFAITFQAWGLLPLCFACAVVYVRNARVVGAAKPISPSKSSSSRAVHGHRRSKASS